MKEEVKILLGIKNNNLKVVEVEEINGIIIATIKNNLSKIRCTECNCFTSSVHDVLKPIKSKYLDSSGQRCELKLIKRRFTCHKCKKTFTENLNINEKNKTLSNKLKIKIRKDLLYYNLSLKYIAKTNNVSDNTIRNELLEAMNNYPEHLRLLPRVISFDEFKADTKKGKYAFILNDPIHKTPLDILPSRKKEYLIQYFTHIENRHSVEYVISDMYEPYLLVQKTMFPKAKYVVDRFHYIRYIMDAVDKIRIKIQKIYNPNSREYKLLKNKQNISLLRKYGCKIDWFVYTKRYRNGHMVDVLPTNIKRELFEISDELKRGYELKELFLDIVNHSVYESVEKELLTWIELCRESKIEEFIDASSTIENWLKYIVNSFIDERFSNGYTEGLNNKIKVIKRIAFGYKNFDFFRLRVLYILKNKIQGGSNNDRNKRNKTNKRMLEKIK